MDKILEALKSITKESKPVIIGMGNEINADDGLGPYIVKQLAKVKFFQAIDVGTLPENFTKKIAGLSPSHIIILDAAMIDGPPGIAGIVDQSTVDEYIFTTHHIPISYTIQRLKAMCSAEVIIIGIKPATLEIGEPMTPAVVRSAQAIIGIFLEIDAKLHLA